MSTSPGDTIAKTSITATPMCLSCFVMAAHVQTQGKQSYWSNCVHMFRVGVEMCYHPKV